MGKPDLKEDYREVRPVSPYDIAANETWLEDLAGKGWRLVGFSRFSGIFERAEPCRCRYRMEPLRKKEKQPDGERAQLYGQMGWEYVATLQGHFHIWRCGDPDAPELDTDPVAQGGSYRYLKRRMARSMAVWAVIFAAYLGTLCWSWFLPETPLWDALNVTRRAVPVFMPAVVRHYCRFGLRFRAVPAAAAPPERRDPA